MTDREAALALARKLSPWALNTWNEDSILDFALAWGKRERDEAEREMIELAADGMRRNQSNDTILQTLRRRRAEE